MTSNNTNRNHHFVPKFYLRYFSLDGNKKQIGVFNMAAAQFIKSAALRFQAYKVNFYGKDGEIEDGLGEIEDKSATLFTKIIEQKRLPHFKSPDHDLMLLFIVVTRNRNPIAAQRFNEAIDQQLKLIFNNFDPPLDKDLHFAHRHAVDISLSGAFQQAHVCSDLGYKLIMNESTVPFISSDNPVILYNQYLEKSDYPLGATGYATAGIQIIFPLNPKILIFLYDKSIYKVGNRNQSNIIIQRSEEIEQLNLLQLLNCIENIYFNHQINKEQIMKIYFTSRKFQKSDQVDTKEINRVFEDGTLKKESSFLWTKMGNLQTRLNLSFVKITTRAKRIKVDHGIVHMRKRFKNQSDERI